MEVYPPELTSPPVPLVALIGRPDLHILVGDFLRTQNSPRVLSMGMPDPLQAAARLGDKGAPQLPGAAAASSAGILKAKWLEKQRGSRPAVAVLLVGRQLVTGDPGSWARLVSEVEAVKGAAKARGMRLVVVVVQSAGEGEIPEDRAAMVCRQAGIDKRLLVTLNPGEGAAALGVLGRLIHDQCTAYYTAEAQRLLGAHSQKVGSPPLLADNLRTAFKLGVLAEFRADWPAAVHMYAEAYNYVPQVASERSVTMPLQRFAELRAVAEFVHVKLVSVLLLAMKQGEEAVAQLERHLRTFKRPALDMPPGLLGSHHAWVCRQYMVMAELLVTSGVDLSLLKREQQPGELYLAAARAAIDRRKVADFIRGLHGPEGLPQLPGQVVPGRYVGQVVLADPPRRLAEEEFVAYLEVEECRAPHSRQTVDLLRAAHEGLLRAQRAQQGAANAPALTPSPKSLHHISLLLGQEILEGGDPRGARTLLEEVAAYYRRTGWSGPLYQALMLLRDCARKLSQPQDSLAYSMEAAALDGPLDAAQRAAIAGTALMTLLEPPLELVAQLGTQQAQQAQREQQQAGGAAASLGQGPGSPRTRIDQGGGFVKGSEGPPSPSSSASQDSPPWSAPDSPGAAGTVRPPPGEGAGAGALPAGPLFSFVADAEGGSGWSSVVRLVAGFLPPTSSSSGAVGGGSQPGVGTQHGQQAQQHHHEPPLLGVPLSPVHGSSSPGAAGAPDGVSMIRFGVSLWNALPMAIPLAGAELALRDERGAFSAPLTDADVSTLQGARSAGAIVLAGAGGTADQGTAAGGDSRPLDSVDALLGLEQPHRDLQPPGEKGAQHAEQLRALAPGGWRRLVAEIPVRSSGTLTATWVKLQLGPHASLALRLGAGAGGGGEKAQALRGLGGPSSPLPPFPSASGFQAGRYSMEVPPRHTPPLLSLGAPRVGLEGEPLTLIVRIEPQEGGALQAAKLVVKALHRDSQQYVPLRLLSLPGQHPPPAPPTAASAEPAVPAQQRAGHTMRHDEALALGDLAGGAVHAVVVEAQPQHRGGQVDARAQLQYSCQPGEGAGAETGKAVVGALIPLQPPFRFDLSLLGPAGTHTLFQAPPVAAQALPTSHSELARQMQGLTTQDSFTSIATERSTALSALSLPPGVSMPSSAPSQLLPPGAPSGPAWGGGGPGAWKDGALAAAGGGGGAGASGDLVLPVGQRCTVAVALRNQAPFELSIMSVDLVPPTPASPAQQQRQQAKQPTEAPLHISITPAATLPGLGEGSSTEAASTSEISDSSNGSGRSGVARLHKGDSYTYLFLLSCPREGQAPSLGQLVVRWRRTAPPAQQQHAVRGGKKVAAPAAGLAGPAGATAGGAGTAAPAGEAMAWVDQLTQEVQASAPQQPPLLQQQLKVGGDCQALEALTPANAPGKVGSPVIESVLALPPVSFLSPLLTVALSHGPSIAVGSPLGCTLRMSNEGAGGIDATVAVKEAHGYVLAGPKATSLHILPRGSDCVSWQLVPTHPGPLRLPTIQLEATGLGYGLEVSKGREVFVERGQAFV